MQGVSDVIATKTSTRTGALCLTLLLISLWCGLPQAVAAKDFRVGVVDTQVVMEKSKAGKRSFATLQEHMAIRQKLIASDEEEIRILQGEFQNAKGLSEKDMQAKQGLFQRKVQEFQRRTQEFTQELAQKEQAMFIEYMGKIAKATQAVADRHGFTLVIEKGRKDRLPIVLYSRKGLDITNEVIKEFNKKFP